MMDTAVLFFPYPSHPFACIQLRFSRHLAFPLVLYFSLQVSFSHLMTVWHRKMMKSSENESHETRPMLNNRPPRAFFLVSLAGKASRLRRAFVEVPLALVELTILRTTAGRRKVVKTGWEERIE